MKITKDQIQLDKIYQLLHSKKHKLDKKELQAIIDAPYNSEIEYRGKNVKVSLMLKAMAKTAINIIEKSK